MTTKLDFEDTLTDFFEERFAEYIDPVDRQVKTDEDGEAVTLPKYWQDDIHEIADGCIPVYNSEIVALWLDLGLPEIEDSGLIDGETDVIRIIAIILYEQASNYLYELANQYGFDN